MRGLKRPVKPSTWETTVQQARQDIAEDVRNGRQLNFDGKAHWRIFKENLRDPDSAMMQCGYCERSLDVDRYRGDVEHYRPKAAATDRSWYTKKGNPVRGSKNRCKPGYYWLAYEWSNLLLACRHCNAKKADFFPVDGTTHRRAVTPGCESTETPKLLNPYDDKHPERHLEFGPLGEVKAVGLGLEYERGYETIEICDLDRDELRIARRKVARRAHDDVLEWLTAKKFGRNDVAASLERGLRQAMDADSPFAGMVRIIFYQVTKQHWTAL